MQGGNGRDTIRNASENQMREKRKREKRKYERNKIGGQLISETSSKESLLARGMKNDVYISQERELMTMKKKICLQL